MRRRYVIAGLGVLAVLVAATPVLAGKGSLASLVKKEVARQIAKAAGPRGLTGAAGAAGQTGTPATRLWASVTPGMTPSISRGSGAISVARNMPANQGQYDVRFNQSVANCSVSATSADAVAGPVTIAFTETDFPAQAGLDADEVFVQTTQIDTNGNATTLSDAKFHVQVFC